MNIQVAGHGNITIANDNSGYVVKPTTTREANFYKNVHMYPQYCKFMPDCIKITKNSLKKDLDKKLGKKIYLENLIFGYTKPCVMDIKLGCKNYPDDAHTERVLKSLHKAVISTSGSHGFRISGCSYFDKDKLRVLHRNECIRNTIDDNTSVILKFFNHNTDLMNCVIGKLEEIKNTLYRNHEFRIYGGSVLLVYDAQNPKKFSVKLIDFSNAYKLQKERTQDDGYIFGITNLIKVLK
jgi:hypothetical protein